MNKNLKKFILFLCLFLSSYTTVFASISIKNLEEFNKLEFEFNAPILKGTANFLHGEVVYLEMSMDSTTKSVYSFIQKAVNSGYKYLFLQSQDYYFLYIFKSVSNVVVKDMVVQFNTKTQAIIFQQNRLDINTLTMSFNMFDRLEYNKFRVVKTKAFTGGTNINDLSSVFLIKSTNIAELISLAQEKPIVPKNAPGTSYSNPLLSLLTSIKVLLQDSLTILKRIDMNIKNIYCQILDSKFINFLDKLDGILAKVTALNFLGNNISNNNISNNSSIEKLLKEQLKIMLMLDSDNDHPDLFAIYNLLKTWGFTNPDYNFSSFYDVLKDMQLKNYNIFEFTGEMNSTLHDIQNMIKNSALLIPPVMNNAKELNNLNARLKDLFNKLCIIQDKVHTIQKFLVDETQVIKEVENVQSAYKDLCNQLPMNELGKNLDSALDSSKIDTTNATKFGEVEILDTKFAILDLSKFTSLVTDIRKFLVAILYISLFFYLFRLFIPKLEV